MAKITEETHPNVSKNERKEIVSRLGHSLRKIKGTNKLCTVKKPDKKS